MKKLIIIIVIAFCTSSFAQNYNFHSFYDQTFSTLNPAYSAFSNKQFYNIQGLIPGQELEKNSYSLWVVADQKVKILHGALGFSYNRFENLSSQSKTLKANYNFQFQIKEHHKISLGISAALDNLYYQSNSYADRYGNIAFVPYDYYGSSLNVMQPLFGAGLMYGYKSFEFGASISNHLEAKSQFYNMLNSGYWEIWDVNKMYLTHLFAKVDLSAMTWLKIQQIAAYQNHAANDFHLFLYNLNFMIKDKILIGSQLTCSTVALESLSLMTGVRILKNLNIKYAYAASVIRYTNKSLGSHEMSLSLAIK